VLRTMVATSSSSVRKTVRRCAVGEKASSAPPPSVGRGQPDRAWLQTAIQPTPHACAFE
jgi:hypothetical protein